MRNPYVLIVVIIIIVIALGLFNSRWSTVKPLGVDDYYPKLFTCHSLGEPPRDEIHCHSVWTKPHTHN